MKEHLDRVCAICRKYEFDPMIWSDMYFMLASEDGRYYSVSEDYECMRKTNRTRSLRSYTGIITMRPRICTERWYIFMKTVRSHVFCGRRLDLERNRAELRKSTGNDTGWDEGHERSGSRQMVLHSLAGRWSGNTDGNLSAFLNIFCRVCLRKRSDERTAA